MKNTRRFHFSHSPQGGRLWWVTAAMLAGWAALALRLGQLQFHDSEELARQAWRQTIREELIAARPGDILDRHGRLLATSLSVRSLWVNPREMSDLNRAADRLAAALELDGETLRRRLWNNERKQFLWIKRRISDAEADRVLELNLPPGSWGFRREYLRRYPQGTLAAHLLGLRDIDGKGRGGVEESLDAQLRGEPGREFLIRDAHGKVIEVRQAESAAPQPGQSVQLTLDAVLQLHAEQELDTVMREWQPISCCAIVLEPTNGEILALASRPGFDPNRPDQVPEEAWNNTAIASIYEPGSTFKPMIVARALQLGAIQRDESIHCGNGAYRMGPRLLHDHHAYGYLSLTDVLVKSSNVGMAKIGEQLGNERMSEAVVDFGFGRRTGVELPGELPGILRPLKEWSIYSTGSIPMGQEISVTPLQLIAAHAALANQGRLLPPTLVLRNSGSRPAAQVVPSEIADWLIQEPMRQVIERGTGKQARLKDFSVFGKTGTAQKVDPKTGGYSHSRHIASFVCGGPVEQPRALVLVVVDQPSKGSYYGGVVAAPAASRLLEKVLRHQNVPLASR